jgi:predicted RNA binding protein YcfA (HicA-like mRNA interferase family)
VGELPAVSGRELVKALARIGYVFDRQRGSHMILRHRDPPHRRAVVPDHREVARGTLRSILREVGITPDEFRELLR